MFRLFNKLASDQSGAVTVDWVVLTAAISGIGIATAAGVSTGVENLSSDTSSQLSAQNVAMAFGSESGTAWNGMTAQDYLNYGSSQAPGNNGATYYHAQQAAAADAPSGYNFDDPLVDPSSGNVVYTSDDGLNYSIGGEVHAVDGYSGSLNPFTA